MGKVTINGKEYQLDIDEAKKQGLLKEGNDRVKSWKEFEEKYRGAYGFHRIPLCDGASWTIPTTAVLETGTQLTRRDADALDAFSKLLKLRRDWIGDWKPDLGEENVDVISIDYVINRFEILSGYIPSALSFPTFKMADEFLETFKYLLEEAKDLI